MRASGPIHPLRDDGSQLEATFEISSVPVYELVFHHKAGARAGPRSVNADYHEALELLLSRLAPLRATILGIAVDSSVARQLPPVERELQLDLPIDLSPSTNPYELRREITRVQKAVARHRDAKPGGGNDQKRIRITVAFQQTTCGFDDLERQLTRSDGARETND